MKNRPMRKGDRVESKFKREPNTGVIASEPMRDALTGRCCVVNWSDGSESLCCTSDLRRDHGETLVNVTDLTWMETEVQGHGRRYWFDSAAKAIQFHAFKLESGYRAVYDGEGSRTVWVPFAKKMNNDTRRQMAGMDPEN